MNNLKVFIHNGRDKSFIVSYLHPLVNRRIRVSFLKLKEAQGYKERVEKKFKKTISTYHKGLTIEELLVCFMREVPNNLFRSKKMHLIDFIESFGDHSICSITSEGLKEWLDQVQVENNLKDITMLGLKCKIDTFFNFLKEKEIVSESPLSMIYYKAQAPPLKSRTLLLPHEIETLMQALKDYSPGYLYPILKMFAETAAKSKELVELTWGQVDLKKGLVTFPKKERVQARTLKISQELIEILRLKSDGGPAPKKRVFMTYYKEPFTYEKLRSAVSEFKKKGSYKGKDWVIGDLRHSFAVNFLTQGGDIRELQKALGHWNVYDTKRLYGEVVKQEVSKEVISPFQ